MSAPVASLPMYDWPEIRDENDRLWAAIRDRFREAGIEAPDALAREADGVSHWRSPDLLFSQTCGYPFATKLIGQVNLLGTPVYDVDGCYGANYSSAIIVRSDDPVGSLEEAASCRFAYNGTDSLSGYRCLVPLIGDPLDFFERHTKSGGHQASAGMVVNGDADIAAVDAVCWHLLRTVEPETSDRLRVLQWGPLFPALPFVTGKDCGPDELSKMRETLRQAVEETRESLPVLSLRDVELLPDETYTPLAAL